MEDDYPWDAGRTDQERRFLARLRELANGRALFDAWDLYPQLVVTLTVDDPEENVIVRTLRVDYDGSSLRGGEDPSSQIDPELDSSDPDYFELTGYASPEALASQAFDWFSRQGRRPIDRREWFGPDHTWLEWVMLEPVEKPLVARYFGRPDRPPDHVVRLDTPQV